MSSIELRVVALSGVPEIGSGDDLAAVILQAVARDGLRLVHGDVLVLAQKIVSKAEGRVVRLSSVAPSERAIRLASQCGERAELVELILREAKEVLRCVPGVIVVEHRLGFVMANAGIDQSNVAQGEDEDNALLLPQDPDASCAHLRAKLRAETGVDVAIVIIDSHGRAWRQGIVGVAIGVAGMPALLDLRGHPDRFGRKLKRTEVGLADELASAASLLMGQAAEGSPIVLVRGVPYARRDGAATELIRPRQKDLFR